MNNSTRQYRHEVAAHPRCSRPLKDSYETNDSCNTNYAARRVRTWGRIACAARSQGYVAEFRGAAVFPRTGVRGIVEAFLIANVSAYIFFVLAVQLPIVVEKWTLAQPIMR